jgi:hypothetical protein
LNRQFFTIPFSEFSNFIFISHLIEKDQSFIKKRKKTGKNKYYVIENKIKHSYTNANLKALVKIWISTS